MKRGWGGALLLSAACAVAALWPALLDPAGSLIGDPDHPDCLGNHWLLDWVASRIGAGQGLLHNPDYYWPVGDAPLLAGNGTDGILAAPLLWLWPWPAGAVAYAFVQRLLDGLAGWLLGRGLGASARAACWMVPAAALSPYALTEASAGRWSQAGTWPLIAALGLWAAFLRSAKPGVGAAAGLLLAASGLLYWYHAWFFVLAAAPMAVGLGLGRRHARGLAWMALCAGGPLLPWLVVFVARWDEVPGVTEAVVTGLSPVGGAALDPRAREAIPGLRALIVAVGGPAGAAALAWPALFAAPLALPLLLRPGPRRRGVVVLVAILVGFFALALGDRGPGSPFRWIYDAAAPLRRFWWPMRHLVLVHLSLAGLGALTLDALGQTRPRLALGLLIIGLGAWLPAAHLQGAPAAVTVRPLSWPRAAWVALAALPEGVVLTPPIAPQAAGSQWPLMAQRAHRHPLLVGHAPWVDRVRPAAWDAAVAEDPALSALAALERGTPIALEGAALRALEGRGLRWLALDRSAFVVDLQPVVQAYDAIFDELCGQPVYRDKGVQIWDLSACSSTAVARAHAPWPAGLAPGGPERPVVGVWPAPSP